MSADLFAWIAAKDRAAIARADAYGVRRVCACGLFWLLHEPQKILTRYTLVKPKRGLA